MIHRLAIIVGSLAAAAIMALGAVAGALTPTSPVDAEQAQGVAATSVDLPSPSPVTRVETRTIYVRPAPKPKVIHVTRRLPSATRPPRAATKRPALRHGEDEHEREGDD